MKNVPHGFILLSGRDIPIPELINLTRPTYQQAFLKGVWHETLSDDVVNSRLTKNFSKDFIGYWLVEQQSHILACTTWFEFTSVHTLKEERGIELAEFSDKIAKSQNIKETVWYTETFTHPHYWNRGFAKMLMNFCFSDLKERSAQTGNILVLVRMRDDNKNILTIGQNLGFIRTGIRMPCTTDPSNPEKYHEYWYTIITPS